MKATEKKPTPVWVYVFAYSSYAAIWSHPVIEGGLHNLTAFYLWCCAIIMLVVAIFALCSEDKPSPYKNPPRWLNWVTRVISFGGLIWLIFHGYFALPAILLSAGLVMMIVHQRAKAAE
ncbi:hypothetical protein [Chromohalobacter sp. HP20-39]|uniref:hypothetical protein n=1 Tax=Chromohalobacter sp. HP20-39 TaxID=3079306 RepID=UPI00294ADABD|nr:hypothetical protein [Chromohalobacter sp. HP20-39]MDV6318786.1 hypothetical protein [Chromohalobacter sp. HP20-39]